MHASISRREKGLVGSMTRFEELLKLRLFDDFKPCWKAPERPPPIDGHYWDCKCEDCA